MTIVIATIKNSQEFSEEIKTLLYDSLTSIRLYTKEMRSSEVGTTMVPHSLQQYAQYPGYGNILKHPPMSEWAEKLATIYNGILFGL